MESGINVCVCVSTLSLSSYSLHQKSSVCSWLWILYLWGKKDAVWKGDADQLFLDGVLGNLSIIEACVCVCVGAERDLV